MLDFTKPPCRIVSLTLILAAAFVCSAEETDPTVPLGIGDVDDGSAAPVVHKISLYDDKGFVIFPGINFNEPFSTIQTCARCHNYDLIDSGRHFNAGDPNTDPGRPGEPWIYWEATTATQIPISYRSWPGTFKPEQLGLSQWWFTRIFGRHMAGGGPGMEPAASDPRDRWAVSGQLEINCLSCHDGEASHDQAEYAGQIARHNFRWAATGSSGFATVEGSARDLPDFQQPGDSSADRPTVTYDRTRFLPGRKVFVDVGGKVLNDRCYFCHSTKIIGDGEGQSEDVHLAAGLKCVDCHRNGLDHAIVRGYEGEPSQNVSAAGLSCRGCHLGEEGSSQPVAGGLGAPVPKHKGIPLVHFQKLTCTACHSGPWPKQQPFGTKTSRAHALGTHGANKDDETLPHIQSPVLAMQQNGRIGPHKALWPAFWASLQGESITPIPPDMVKNAAGKILYLDVELESASWPELTEETVAKVLAALSSGASLEGEPVYISGGKMHRLAEGKIAASQHNAAKPYLWPIGHNVRPAAQSLGVRGCGDCHSTKAAFIFGQVPVDSPLASDQQPGMKMIDFQDGDPVYARLFAMSFVFRPWFKIISIASCLVLGAVVLLYGFKALACVLAVLGGQEFAATCQAGEPVERVQSDDKGLSRILNLLKKPAYLAALVCFVVLTITGFYPLLLGKSLSGYWVMAHATAAPVFAACIAILAIFWADRNSFSRFRAKSQNSETAPKDYRPCPKIAFWMIIVLALPLILSIVLMMFPIVSADTQKCLLHVHRYAALLLVPAAAAHILLTAKNRKPGKK